MTTLLADYSSKTIVRRFTGFSKLTNNTELVPNLSVGFLWDAKNNLAIVINMDPNFDERYAVIASLELVPARVKDPSISKAFHIKQYWQREAESPEYVDPYDFDKSPSFDVPKTLSKKTLLVYLLEGVAMLGLTIVNAEHQGAFWRMIVSKVKGTSTTLMIVNDPKSSLIAIKSRPVEPEKSKPKKKRKKKRHSI